MQTYYPAKLVGKLESNTKFYTIFCNTISGIEQMTLSMSISGIADVLTSESDGSFGLCYDAPIDSFFQDDPARIFNVSKLNSKERLAFEREVLKNLGG